jgi:CubicO group peptidase (beta-lactamase class C family)
VWRETDDLIGRALEAGVVPGLTVCVHDGDEVLFETAGGSSELRPQAREASLETVWDLASLTKVLCTTPLVISMLGEGVMELDQPLSRLLPGASDLIHPAHCLQHSSGWPAWRPFFSELCYPRAEWGSEAVREAVLAAILEIPVETPPGTHHQYSDLGMIALGFAIERFHGARIDQVFQERIAGPLGVELTWGHPEAAATEDCPVRDRVLRGEVHDLNCALMGGASGHAGLFGTARSVAESVAIQLRSWKGRGALSTEWVREFWSRTGPGSHRLGWDSPSGPDSAAGGSWPRSGVGHLAFTGCSVWVVPERSWIVVLCSNRLHPEVEGGAVPDAEPGPRTRAFRSLRSHLYTTVLQTLMSQ